MIAGNVTLVAMCFGDVQMVEMASDKFIVIVDDSKVWWPLVYVVPAAASLRQRVSRKQRHGSAPVRWCL